jgi:hypothetical protein
MNMKSARWSSASSVGRSIDLSRLANNVVGADNLIVAGHARAVAVREAGLTEVPVIVLDHLTGQVRLTHIAPPRSEPAGLSF